MKIGSSTSSYISSISIASKQTYDKTNRVDSLINKYSDISISTNRSNDNSDSILDYYHDICKKYPNVSFRLEDFETGSKMPSEPPYLGYNNSFNQIGDNFGNSGQCSITIDKKVIENMQKDTVYKEIVYSYIENLEAQQVGYQQYSTQEGMSCFAHVLEDNNGVLAPSTIYAHSAFSTEEEVRRIWNMEGSNKEISKAVEQLKGELIDIYLVMLEQSEKTKEMILTEAKDTEEKKAGVENKTIELDNGILLDI